MYLTTLIVLLYLQCLPYVLATPSQQPDDQIEMTPVDSGPGANTWFTRKKPGELGITDEIPTYEDVLKVARRCFAWAVKQADARSSNGIVLVSAMYEPTSGDIWASTVPHGTLTKQAPATQQEAPFWFEAISDMRDGDTSNLQSNDHYHAEDRILPAFEKQYRLDEFYKSKYAEPESDEQKYPKGSVLAVWITKSSKDTEGREYGPCVDRCKGHLDQLGVAYKPIRKTMLSLNGHDVTLQELVQYAEATKDSYNNWLLCDIQRRRLRMRGMQTAVSACHYRNSTADRTGSSHATPDATSYPQIASTNATSSGRFMNTVVSHTASSFTHGALTTTAFTYSNSSSSHGPVPETTTYKPTADVPPPATLTTTSCTQQVCSYVSAGGVQTCSYGTIDGCVVQTGAATIEAGTKPVHVGTLTGGALYTSVSNALESACPPVTQTDTLTECSENDFTAANRLDYVNGENDIQRDGELVVTVKSSGYNVTSLRDAMIQSAATAAQYSAMNKNCYEQVWHSGIKRSILSRWVPGSLRERLYDPGPPLEHSSTWCNMHDFAGVQYFGPYWKSDPQPHADDYMDIDFSFKIPKDDEFWCELSAEIATAALEAIAPQFTVEDIELGNAIDILCKETQ